MEPPKHGSFGRNSMIRIAMVYVLPGVFLAASVLYGIIFIVSTIRRFYLDLLYAAVFGGIIIGVLMVFAWRKQELNLPGLKARFMIEGSGSDIRYAAYAEFDSNNNRSSINTKQPKITYLTDEDS